MAVKLKKKSKPLSKADKVYVDEVFDRDVNDPEDRFMEELKEPEFDNDADVNEDVEEKENVKTVRARRKRAKAEVSENGRVRTSSVVDLMAEIENLKRACDRLSRYTVFGVRAPRGRRGKRKARTRQK